MTPDESMATDILQELLQSLEGCFEGRPSPDVRAIHPPPGGSGEQTSPFTLVVLDTSPTAAGLCFNLLEDDEARARYDALDLAGLTSGGDALRLAQRVLEGDPTERIVGYAACHALSQLLLGEAREAGTPSPTWRVSASDLIELADPGAADNVGLVGFAPPMVRRLLEVGAGRVTVLERESRARSLPPVEGATITTSSSDLAKCNKVLITSTTLLNDTFDELEQLSRGADFRAVYGPGASVLPDALLSRGIDAVAGLVVTQADTLIERQLSGERWGDAKRKVIFQSP